MTLRHSWPEYPGTDIMVDYYVVVKYPRQVSAFYDARKQVKLVLKDLKNTRTNMSFSELENEHLIKHSKARISDFTRMVESMVKIVRA